ncbi:hypothetical protein C8Q76DRAFT_421266 [Earliella scabrosa]|nr:hypothetical protein C8Q76DRAFT_421266 [Earliella scabrosa]
MLGSEMVTPRESPNNSNTFIKSLSSAPRFRSRLAPRSMSSKRKRAQARRRRRHKCITSPIQRLPNELLLLILEHVVGRHHSESESESRWDAYYGRWQSCGPSVGIKSLSLVCKLWRSLLLPTLFRTLDLGGTGHHRPQDLSCSLFNENAGIRRCIQEVCISQQEWGTTPSEYPAFARLLIDLTALQYLTLADMELRVPERNPLLEISERISLKRLVLAYVSVHHPGGEADILSTVLGILPVSAIDHLQTQSAFGRYLENGDLFTNPAHGWRSQDVSIRALTLDRPCSTADHFRYLQHALVSGCLNSLRAKWGRWKDASAMSSLLGVAGRNLQTLDVSLTTLIEIEEEAECGGQGTPLSPPWDILRAAVEACPRLRFLRIRTLPRRSCDKWPFTPSRYLPWQAVAPVLPSTIEEVVHELHNRWDTKWYDEDTLQLWGIEALDNLGSVEGRKTYTQLMKVLVEHKVPECGIRDADYAVMTRVIEELPQLKAAGLLKFTHVGWLSCTGDSEMDANEFDREDWLRRYPSSEALDDPSNSDGGDQESYADADEALEVNDVPREREDAHADER